jgi:hypothetical protein
MMASAFLADGEDMISLVERPPKKSQPGWFKKARNYLAIAAATILLARTNFITTPTSQEGYELALQNGVTVYNTSDVAHHSLASLVDEFPNL